MERRGFLGLTAGFSISGFGGCLTGRGPSGGEDEPEDAGEQDTNPGRDPDEENETEVPTYDCPRIGHLEVYVAPDVPAEKPVLDAEKDGLTDSKYLSDALTAASEAYEPGMEDEIAPSERTDPDNRLAGIDSEELAASDNVTEKLEYGEPTYVEYEDATYLLVYVESVC
ncbi:hypothetical protein [Halopiger xanaduensis]|uniref:Uncharacterized protein n=1 Tax=Halopiger xanaduensis (strain DSM 18323 / JCM 14033 / SH-6) TaxID=797210 RepID=F8DA02_HALXS|nr:hypothetical protein [Halopiger xanaduensis]AEH36918.1 hypothetical protein Halxa_2293 [Halopiger xanaduensis SH-6]